VTENIIVLGELNEELYYESDYYDKIVQEIVSRLSSFIRYNPDDLSKEIIKKIVIKGFSNTPNRIVGHGFFKRGGTGNNSSELLVRLGIPTKLISVIGRGSKWMIAELDKLGVNTTNISQINEVTPVNTIIKSKLIPKIHIASNLKRKMNFYELTVEDNEFENSKIIFSTPISKNNKNLLEKGLEFGLITAFGIMSETTPSIEHLELLIDKRHDIFFLNLKDAFSILKGECLINQVDSNFKNYAKIRVYLTGKNGSIVKTNNFGLTFPRVEEETRIDLTGVDDCFAAGFLAKMFELVKDKRTLNQLVAREEVENLKEVLRLCIEFATNIATYKIINLSTPTRKELDEFTKNIKKE